MKLADQLRSNIEFKNIIQKLEREIVVGNETVFVQCDGTVLQRLRDEGFNVNTDGIQYNGGAYVSLKQPTQWGNH